MANNPHGNTRALTATWTAVGLILLAILLLYFIKIMVPSLSLFDSSKTGTEQGAGAGTTGTGSGSTGTAGSTGAGGAGGTGGNSQILPNVAVPSVTAVPTVPHIPGL